MRRVLVIAASELSRILRDPMVIAFLVGPSVVYPMIVLGTFQFLMAEDARHEREVVRLAIASDVPDALREAFAEPPFSARPLVADPEPALIEGTLDVALTGQFDGPRWSVTLRHVAVFPRARRAVGKVEDALGALRKRRFEALVSDDARGLADLDVDLEFVGPVQGMLLRIGGLLLGAFAVVPMLFGALYPAVDAIGAEREHETLETLLVSAVPRRTWFFGKALACTTMTVLGSLANVALLVLALLQVQLLLAAGVLPNDILLRWNGLSTLGGMPALLATAWLIAATMLLAVSIGRTYKEGQVLGTTLMILPLVPASAAATAFEGEPAPELLVVPFANTIVAVQRGIVGDLGLLEAVVPVLVNGGLGLVAGILALRIVEREDFLEGWSVGTLWRQICGGEA